MSERAFKYAIIGAGLAGGAAADGIREIDKEGPIVLVGAEKHLPYHRPPLSKQLWRGKKKVESIFLHDQSYYDQQKVATVLDTVVTRLDARGKVFLDAGGNSYRYEKLLLATGGVPRRLAVPGGDLGEICYYRYLDDYLRLRPQVIEGKTACVIGGGFIGSELAAALSYNKMRVTMVFSGRHVCGRVFHESLAQATDANYRDKGIALTPNHHIASIARSGRKFIVNTSEGPRIECDLVAAGIGIEPSMDLARSAALIVEDGIVVNEQLQTSNDDIYAAGDNANFIYPSLGIRTRVEHWDCAMTQGKLAGRNMAGACETYTHMPFFFSDLLDFGYEAVGMVGPRLDVVEDWKEPNKTGVVYFLKNRKVCGAMMCNVWGKVPAATEIIRQGKEIEPGQLKSMIS